MDLGLLSYGLDDMRQRLNQRLDQIAGDFGLSATQWRVLSCVVYQGGLTQSDVARILNFERATIGQAIDALETAEYVRREKKPEDRRVYVLAATDAGRALVGESREAVEKISAQVFSGFSAQELAQLEEYVLRAIENVKALPV